LPHFRSFSALVSRASIPCPAGDGKLSGPCELQAVPPLPILKHLAVHPGAAFGQFHPEIAPATARADARHRDARADAASQNAV